MGIQKVVDGPIIREQKGINDKPHDPPFDNRHAKMNKLRTNGDANLVAKSLNFLRTEEQASNHGND